MSFLIIRAISFPQHVRSLRKKMDCDFVFFFLTTAYLVTKIMSGMCLLLMQCWVNKWLRMSTCKWQRTFPNFQNSKHSKFQTSFAWISLNISLRLEHLTYLYKRTSELSICVLLIFPGGYICIVNSVITWIICLSCMDWGISTDTITRGVATLHCIIPGGTIHIMIHISGTLLTVCWSPNK